MSVDEIKEGLATVVYEVYYQLFCSTHNPDLICNEIDDFKKISTDYLDGFKDSLKKWQEETQNV